MGLFGLKLASGTDSGLPRAHESTPTSVLAACGVFLLLGLTLIPYAGIQTDESIFANPFTGLTDDDLRVRLFHLDIPLMVGSYIGTLKTMLYWPILALFGPNAFSVRVPMVIVGALTVLALYKLAARLVSPGAGLVAALLLATDPTFLLTNTFDWGPVAIEHLLLVTGCLMIACQRLSLGCFLFGLALWNKATFLWTLAGLAAGVIAAYFPALRRTLADRTKVARAACAFLAGALPLIAYNIHRPNATLKLNAHLSAENLGAKFLQLKNAANGSGLFGYMVSEEWAENPKPPVSWHGRASQWIRDHMGERRSSLFLYGIVLAVLASPLWWRPPLRQAGVFAVAFSMVTFLAMALTRGAGAAIHHTVLLWPMPHLLVGMAITALRPRWLPIALGGLLVTANLLVVNQYLIQFERNGAAGSFTDAIYPLSKSLSDFPGDNIYIIDWGMRDNLALLHGGRAGRIWAADLLLTANPDEVQRREIGRMLSDPHGLFLDHVPSREVFRGVGEHLNAAGRELHLTRQPVRSIPDSNNRPVFEIFRFVRLHDMNPVIEPWRAR